MLKVKYFAMETPLATFDKNDRSTEDSVIKKILW